MAQPLNNSESFVTKLKRIETLISDGDLQGAVTELNTLSSVAGADPRLFLLGAKLAESAGNPSGMLTAAQRAYELAPTWPVASLFYAQLLANRGDSAQAMAMANRSYVDAQSQKCLTFDHLKKLGSIARSAGHHQDAHRWLVAAEALAPEETSIQYQLGLLEITLDSLEVAITRFSHLLEVHVNHPAILSSRMQAYIAAKNLALATQDGESLRVSHPEYAQEVDFLLSVARGETPSTMPNALVTQTFSELAGQFNQKLVSQLNYQLPRKVADLILAWYPDLSCDILDLGCGTGLLGANLGPMQGVLVGVDLSQAMVEQAALHRVYDKFHLVNIADALRETPPEQYNIITALDVLIYVGALEQMLRDSKRILVPSGRLVFSCEAAPDDAKDFVLNDSFRYSHTKAYLERLLTESGFTTVTIENCTLRYEAGHAVHGYLVVAQ